MNSYVHDPSLTIFGKLVVLAYPIMDIALVFIVFRSLLFGRAEQTIPQAAGRRLICMFLADFVYDLLVLHNSYQTGNSVDGLFLITYVLIGVAALHPSIGETPPDHAEAGTQRLPHGEQRRSRASRSWHSPGSSPRPSCWWPAATS